MASMSHSLGSVSDSLDRVSDRLDRVSDRLDRVSDRLDSVSDRLDTVSERLDGLTAFGLPFQAVVVYNWRAGQLHQSLQAHSKEVTKVHAHIKFFS